MKRRSDPVNHNNNKSMRLLRRPAFAGLLAMTILVWAIMILGLAASSSATIINIPADWPTIQQGIDASADGDTVLVQPGTYVENINFNGHNIVLGSLFLTTGDTSYIEQTIIDGDSAGSVVTFESGEDSAAIITGFVIQNGCAANGGAIYCDNSNPTIIRNIIRDNYAFGAYWSYGGGIYCENNSSTIIDGNKITGNWAPGGGGIYCIQSNITIINNIISENTVRVGGGIYCKESSAIIKGNNIYENTADWIGGGLSCSDADPIIINNYISGNIAGNHWAATCGGGVSLLRSSPIIINTVIQGNNSDTAAGIFCQENSDPIIMNCVISANYGLDWGGGIACFVSCFPLITNSILWDNIPYAISLDYSCDPQIAFCDIQGGWLGTGNIDIDPLFRDPDNCDFHLMSIACGDSADSPCIDAGDPNILDSLLDCSWGLGGPRSDMGAYGGGDSLITGIFDNIPSLPHRLMLLQNYPNPFNAQTTIRFILPESQNVQLTVYDLLGRRVEILIDEYKQAGVHSVTFDASSLSSGVYFYKLHAGDEIETKRMVLLK